MDDHKIAYKKIANKSLGNVLLSACALVFQNYSLTIKCNVSSIYCFTYYRKVYKHSILYILCVIG